MPYFTAAGGQCSSFFAHKFGRELKYSDGKQYCNVEYQSVMPNTEYRMGMNGGGLKLQCSKIKLHDCNGLYPPD